MKVSVIIITYMFEEYIEQSLISALGQKTNFEYEILVRDDFSSDKSMQHIRRIAELNKKIKFFEPNRNLGPTKNFEFLYSKAKGEYIAILDGDDYWDNMGLLQKSVDYLENNIDTSMVFCGHRQKWLKDKNRIVPPEIDKWMGISLDIKDCVTTDNLLEKNYVGFGKVFKKIENLFEPWIYELPYLDWGINYRLSCYGKIKYLNFPGGIYRIHNKGIFSGEDDEKRKYNLLKSKEIIKKNHNKEMNKKIKLLYLTPHLSTGGMPQFVLKRIEDLQNFKDQIELFLVEYSQFSDTYIVQRNEIIKLLGESHFFSLGGTTETKRKYQLIDIIKNNNIDIVHSEEMLEGFEGFNRIPLDLINQIYSNDRTWRMVETCHNVWFDPINLKKVHPEAYALVTPFHKESTFLSVPSYTETITYPYENKVKDILEKNEIYGEFNQVPLIKKIQVRQELGLDMFKTHVLNVGLWTEGKNQIETILNFILLETKPLILNLIGDL